MPATIEAIRLTKEYDGRKVVDQLDLQVDAGEVFGLLGPNGAGKTTTILMILGLTEPTSGTVSVLGLDPVRNPIGVKSRVGYLPDAVGFYERMTGRENLRFTARLNGLGAIEAEARIDELLAEVGLGHAGDTPAGTYSRGMLQRLGIADALVKRPQVLILDEPTASIDPEGVADILALIRRLADEQGVTVLLSSHLLNQVQAVCDRVAIFVGGKVMASGATHDLARAGIGPERVEVGIDGGDESVRRATAGLGFVSSVMPGRMPGTWIFELERGNTHRLVARLVEEGQPVWQVRRLSDDLDEIYRRFFHPEEVGA